MKEYHKIESIFVFDKESKKHIYGEFYNPDVEALKDNQWVVTEKIDGMNFRIIWDGHSLTYGGRTDATTFSKSQIDFITDELVNSHIETLFEQKFMDKKVIVYGELFGVNIQKGGLYTDNSGIYFMVFDIEVDDIFLTKYDAHDLAMDLGYYFVPIVGEMTLPELLTEINHREVSHFSSAKLEGYVATPVGDFRSRLGKRIIVKIKKDQMEGGIR